MLRFLRQRNLRALLLVALPGLCVATDDCADRAVQWQEINVGSGVSTEHAVVSAPLTLRVPVGVDDQFRAECLKLEGFDPAATMAAEIDAAGRCREEARRVRLVREEASGGGARIGGELDEAAYRECLQREVEVEVLPEP